MKFINLYKEIIYNPKFKVRVRLYGKKYYCLEYKHKGFFKFWTKLINPFIMYEISLWDYNQPYLESFESAVELAQKMDEKYLEEYLTAQARRWSENYQRVRLEKIKAVNKYYEK
jgi:hypothetical protein